MIAGTVGLESGREFLAHGGRQGKSGYVCFASFLLLFVGVQGTRVRA